MKSTHQHPGTAEPEDEPDAAEDADHGSDPAGGDNGDHEDGDEVVETEEEPESEEEPFSFNRSIEFAIPFETNRIKSHFVLPSLTRRWQADLLKEKNQTIPKMRQAS